MILLLVIPVYLMLNVYVFMRTFMWIRSIVKVSHHKIIGAIYFVIYAFFAVIHLPSTSAVSSSDIW